MTDEQEKERAEQWLNEQAALDLLEEDWAKFNTRRKSAPHWRPHLAELNLSGCRLERFDLRGCTFKNVFFRDTNCHGVLFIGSVFDECVFDRAHLKQASFLGARLTRCSLYKVILEHTSFEGAHLLNTHLHADRSATPHPEADDYHVSFRRAQIIDSSLNDVLLSGANNLFDYASFEKLRGGYLKTEELLSDARWHTVFLGTARLHRELRSGHPPTNTAPEAQAPPPPSMLQEMQDGAIRAASEELTIACRDLAVQGVTSLPLSNELRDKLISFLKTKPGEHLIAGLLSLVLQSGITDHLPLIPDEVKALLRERLPRELRVGAMQQIFKELGKLLLGAAGSTIAKLQEAAAASPSSTPEPARLPEPSATPFRTVPRSRIKTAPARARRGG